MTEIQLTETITCPFDMITSHKLTLIFRGNVNRETDPSAGEARHLPRGLDTFEVCDFECVSAETSMGAVDIELLKRCDEWEEIEQRAITALIEEG